ncbi:MAG: hypothetical protein H7X76_07615 [Prolixibacteraceae bacterium]|nr:hypothetical protein [Burkholderiales bacterium]
MMCEFRALSCLRERPWQQELPAAYRSTVIAPARFDDQIDEMSGGSRVIGYDCEGTPCYCRYSYVLQLVHSDDDDDFYLAPGYVRHAWGWRLGSGEWLTCTREDHAPGDCSAARLRYAKTDSMPR